MINIADLPAVRAQLAQDAAAGRASTGAQAASTQDQVSVEVQPEQASSYPAKTLVLRDGRYHAVSQKK